MNFLNKINDKLNKRKKEYLYRSIKKIVTEDKYIIYNNKKYLNLSSNDYLGLASNREIKQYIVKNIDKFPIGAKASRLISGNLDIFEEVEEEFSKFKKKEKSLIYPSGYMANIGFFSAFKEMKNDIIVLLDKNIHASIIDAVLLSGIKFFRFKHNDIESLKRLYNKYKDKFYLIIAVESIYSMDGDKAPLIDIYNLIKENENVILYIDEAHSTGIYGAHGEGLVNYLGLEDERIVILSTGGKALGVQGGIISASNIIIQFLINYSRSFIYTTGISPIILLGLKKSLEIIKNSNIVDEFKKKISFFRNEFKKIGFTTIDSDSPIVPIILGDNLSTIKLSQYLLDNHIYSVAIRPPTVAPNTSRIRLSLTNLLNYNDLKYVINVLKDMYNKL